MMSYKAIICEYLYKVLDSCGSSYSTMLSGVFKVFLVIRALRVITEGTLDSSPMFFSYEFLKLRSKEVLKGH
jgi:hypothetical protein